MKARDRISQVVRLCFRLYFGSSEWTGKNINWKNTKDKGKLLRIFYVIKFATVTQWIYIGIGSDTEEFTIGGSCLYGVCGINFMYR